ncbi:hypothetical protein CKALI_11455 [Corynebacterium kalinowskii]|uniref:Uncharacterized protein n=1 Tax=Corynebacterium kalinowskii TaxID=2675216 RepID=A0A6B8VW27_9CORY|nr:hypothetical protein [Corynebacterium kalinowskii]QGU03135.1 hypothetical protein CKALI_11455 [Corynebacterium kalinowskii]
MELIATDAELNILGQIHDQFRLEQIQSNQTRKTTPAELVDDIRVPSALSEHKRLTAVIQLDIQLTHLTFQGSVPRRSEAQHQELCAGYRGVGRRKANRKETIMDKLAEANLRLAEGAHRVADAELTLAVQRYIETSDSYVDLLATGKSDDGALGKARITYKVARKRLEHAIDVAVSALRRLRKVQEQAVAPQESPGNPDTAHVALLLVHRGIDFGVI